MTLEWLKKEDEESESVQARRPDNRKGVPLAFQTRRPITVMRRLLCVGRKMTDDRATFDKAVVESVRPFCLDKELALSVRLAVLRLLKDNSCSVNEEDEALLLHLETMTLLQETWPGVSIAQTDTETSQGRDKVFKRLLDASSNEEQLDTLCRLLSSWPSLDSVRFVSQVFLDFY